MDSPIPGDDGGRRKQDAGPSEPMATEQDVYYAYRLILQREPDPDGLAHYCAHVAKGLSRAQLVSNFLNCEEYRLRAGREAQPTPVDLGGYQVVIQRSDTDFGQALYHSGLYEEHVRQAIRESLRAGNVAVDVGANVGVMTFLAASLVGREGRVIAVEPNPDNLQLLYRGIVLNGYKNVEVLPYAASNAFGLSRLAGGASNTHLVGANREEEGRRLAQTVLLDEALGGLPRLDFVKMDIEGHEPLALEGFSRTIARHRPTLLLEFNPRCLLELQKQIPIEFLNQLFAFARRIRVLSAFQDDQVFERSDLLWSYWERRNCEITAQKVLPDRMLHFDLLITP